MERIKVEHGPSQFSLLFAITFLIADIVVLYILFLMISYIDQLNPSNLVIIFVLFVLIIMFTLVFFGFIEKYIRANYSEEYYLIDDVGVTNVCKSVVPIPWLNTSRTIPYHQIEKIVIRKLHPNVEKVIRNEMLIGDEDLKRYKPDIVHVLIYPKKGTDAEYVKMLGIRFKVPCYNFTIHIKDVDRIKDAMKDKVKVDVDI